MRRNGSSYLSLTLALATFCSSAVAPVFAAGQSDLNFKIYAPDTFKPLGVESGAPSRSPETNTTPALESESPKLDETSPSVSESPTVPMEEPKLSNEAPQADTSTATNTTTTTTQGDEAQAERKLLKGYARVVPVGTKIPIIMDTAIDSDTSQEGDEFTARTSEDLSIDGSTLIPAGSVIKGRIAQLNAPKHMSRSGSVALKFDTVTTPDDRQIPLVATLVARGGVVHARRGLKDIAFDTGTVALPMAVGLGIGALAAGSSNSSSSSSSSGMGRAGGALIGAGVGAAVGIAILLAKKGKRVDVRPGDELKIELAEELDVNKNM
ncbi:MAG: TrbI/VirB10 family protein [Candidatus Melainabacteria bacterium]|nr:TrbI/VirB10 family protein [Candidatus Melainabacteria bacterium]